MKFGKNILVIFLLFMFAAPNYAHPSIYSSTNGTTTIESISPSPTTFSETDTTATITTVTTKKPLHIFKETTTTTLATTTTLLSTVNEKVTETATGKDGNAINSDKSSSDGSKNYIIPVVCAILCLIIIAAVIYFIHRYCLKKRSTVKAVKSDTTLPQNDVTKTPTTNLKTTPTKTPPTPTNPMAPEHLAAETFAYKGPLVLQTKPPTEVPLVHELDNEKPQSIHESHHVIFDDALNEVHEIGSDVEIFMDGEMKMPKKARSSVPSPYGEPSKPNGGSVKKKKMGEKQKDKAIRE